MLSSRSLHMFWRNGPRPYLLQEEEEEEEDDGNVSDPPPMEYNADRDREINEDPDQSDGGEGAGDPEEVDCSSVMILVILYCSRCCCYCC